MHLIWPFWTCHQKLFWSTWGLCEGTSIDSWHCQLCQLHAYGRYIGCKWLVSFCFSCFLQSTGKKAIFPGGITRDSFSPNIGFGFMKVVPLVSLTLICLENCVKIKKFVTFDDWLAQKTPQPGSQRDFHGITRDFSSKNFYNTCYLSSQYTHLLTKFSSHKKMSYFL